MDVRKKREAEVAAFIAEIDANIDATERHIAQLRAEIDRHTLRLTDLKTERDVRAFFWSAAQPR